MQKHVNLVDLVKSFLTSIYYLLANIGFNTAENAHLKVFWGGRSLKFVMRTLNRPRLFRAYRDADAFCIVVELLSGGELLELIYAHADFSERAAARVGRQMFQAMFVRTPR